jgi:hypothetical protein
MFSIRNSDIRTAWILSGAIHLAIFAIAVIILFTHGPVDTRNQIVFLVSEGQSNHAAKSQQLNRNQVAPQSENPAALQPVAQGLSAAAVKPAQVSSSAQGTSLAKK